MIINVKSTGRTQLIDITAAIKKEISKSRIRNGLAHVYSMHTTAGITINENADPDVKRDIISSLEKLVPWEDDYLHMEGNSAAHLKTSLVGSSETIPIEDGHIVLGTWQGIFFCEFDGPRNRKVKLTIMPN